MDKTDEKLMWRKRCLVLPDCLPKERKGVADNLTERIPRTGDIDGEAQSTRTDAAIREEQ